MKPTKKPVVAVSSLSPNAYPIFKPTFIPSQIDQTNPSLIPTVKTPSLSFHCDPYTVSNTNFALKNYALCIFTAYGGSILTVSTCGASCNGDICAFV